MLGRLTSLTLVVGLIGAGAVGYRRLKAVREKAATLNRVDTGSVW